MVESEGIGEGRGWRKEEEDVIVNLKNIKVTASSSEVIRTINNI